MNTPTQQGYLILADITGFTPFVASTELEHSQEIIQHMLKGILSFLTPAFMLAEVEGDAVFVYSRSPNVRKSQIGDALEREQISQKERVLNVIESTYFSFRDKKSSFNRIRSCNCNACQMASSLDLKFVVHYGDYIMNDVGGKTKPLGPSVNVAHRLLKNHVTEATGWKAYVLFTKDCVDRIGMNSPNAHMQTETFEHIGEIETFSIDLDAQYKNHINERRVCLSAEEADFVVQKDFPVPPSSLWEWFNDPKKKNSWSIGADWHTGSRPSGRVGRGATNHCVNSKVIEMILDYRPFEYYTSAMGRGPFNFTVTAKFEEIASGTRLFWHVKMNSILPKGMRRFVCSTILEKGMKIHEGLETLVGLVQVKG